MSRKLPFCANSVFQEKRNQKKKLSFDDGQGGIQNDGAGVAGAGAGAGAAASRLHLGARGVAGGPAQGSERERREGERN